MIFWRGLRSVTDGKLLSHYLSFLLIDLVLVSVHAWWFVTISWTLHYIQGSFNSTDIVYWALRRHYRITNQLYSGISRVMNSKLLQAIIDHTLILGLWQGWSHLLWMSIKLNRKLKSIFTSDQLCCSWVDIHTSTAWSTVTSRGPVETAHPTWYLISGNFLIFDSNLIDSRK